MIYYDEHNIPVEHNGDGGDSSMRVGMSVIFPAPSNADLFVKQDGEFVRHPFQFPWNNPKNFTIDQMIPLVVNLSRTEHGRYAIRKNLYNRMKGFFRGQNTERDKPGSTKYMKPHWFYKDSIPNTDVSFRPDGLDDYYPIEYRKADGADVMQPHYIWHMIKASRTYSLYWFAIIGIPYYLLALIVHGLNKAKYEENQQFMLAYMQGNWALKLYKLFAFNEEISKKYWTDRNEVEYHEAIIKHLEDL